ncbi:MAG: amino acid adenylation domain-containing protein, partial [Algicola sp.]|nr:amino acid adenylation domain-containing protein [Algicola sp.]
VLGLKQVGITDNYFELGGHSLLLLPLMSKVAEQGYQLNINEVYQSATLGDMATTLKIKAEEDNFAPANLITDSDEVITPQMLPLVSLTQSDIDLIVAKIPGGRRNIQDIYALAPLQEGVLYIHQMTQGRDPYLLNSVLECDDSGTLDKLLQALKVIIARHDVLRTAVISQGVSNVAQVVVKKAELPVEHLTFEPLTLGAETSVKQAFYDHVECGEHRINLESAPLMKVQIAHDKSPDKGKSKGKGKYFVMLHFHHLVADHISNEVLIDEMITAMRGGAIKANASALYREFVFRAQQNLLTQDVAQFFSRQLADIETPTLPFGLSNTTGNGANINEITAQIEPDVSLRIRNVMRPRKSSPAVFFHAVWAIILRALSQENNVVFGTVLTGRMSGVQGIEHALGMMINTLPVRMSMADVDANTLIEAVDQILKAVIPFEQVSLAQAQSYSSVQRGVPLFSATLNYRHSPKLDDADLTQLNEGADFGQGLTLISSNERTNYPCALSVNDFGGAHGFSFDLQLQNSVNIERVVGYIQVAVQSLLSALENGGQQPIDTISILPSSEQNYLVSGINDTTADYPKDQTIHLLFEAQAANNPDNVAVLFEDNQLTYKQLNEKANQLAHLLKQHHDIKPDTLVGLCAERSLEMVIGVMAILKAGGAYVPLDPAYPQERLGYMLEDAHLKVVLSQSGVQDVLPSFNGTVLLMDGLSETTPQTESHLCAGFDTRNLIDTGVTASNLAYVIYTSGSTGKPKGVLIEHGNTVSMLNWALDEYSKDQLAVILASTSLNFDLSVYELFLPLSAGTSLRVVMNVLDLSSSEHVSDVTLINTVPSAMDGLLKVGAIPEAVQVINLAGEALPNALLNGILDAHPDIVVCNLYGPSEDTTYSTYSRFVQKCQDAPHIGRVLPNSIGLILDGDQKLVPYGVSGELYLGGDGVSRGYLNLPDLTAQQYITNPLFVDGQPQTAKRLYRTGDIVRYLPDGNIAYLGRADHQVKIRGFRIELGDIEHHLGGLALVDSALVLAQEAAGSMQLVGYVKPTEALDNEGIPKYITSLKESLAQTLPVHMVPGIIMVLDEWPLTPNGKIDRKALPAPDAARLQNEYVAPLNETEQALVEIWGALMDLAPESISTTANFFELGGHSLLIMRLVTQIQQQFDLAELSHTSILEAQTIHQQAIEINYLLSARLDSQATEDYEEEEW